MIKKDVAFPIITCAHHYKSCRTHTHTNKDLIKLGGIELFISTLNYSNQEMKVDKELSLPTLFVELSFFQFAHQNKHANCSSCLYYLLEIHILKAFNSKIFGSIQFFFLTFQALIT